MNRLSKKWITFVLLFTLSLLANLIIGPLKASDHIFGKLGAVFVIPYLHYFLLGVLIRVYWANLSKYLEGRIAYWAVIYFLFSWIFSMHLGIDLTTYWISSPIQLLATVLLAGLVFSFAFSWIGLSEKLLQGNDISYGVYIYHMLVINFLVHRGFTQDWKYLLVTLIASSLLAYLSWRYVEKPALRLKYKKILG